MKLYEINNALESLEFVDKETGEVDLAMFESLQLEFATKVENCACYIKNLESDAEAIAKEMKALQERKAATHRKADGLRQYLASILQGRKMEFPRAKISFRKSESIIVEEGFVEWAKENAPHLLSYKEPSANKTAIKEQMQNECVRFAHIDENDNIQIK